MNTRIQPKPSEETKHLAMYVAMAVRNAMEEPELNDDYIKLWEMYS